eukprot:1372878-Pleurochrysis_carterae.AAC.1
MWAIEGDIGRIAGGGAVKIGASHKRYRVSKAVVISICLINQVRLRSAAKQLCDTNKQIWRRGKRAAWPLRRWRARSRGVALRPVRPFETRRAAAILRRFHALGSQFTRLGVQHAKCGCACALAVLGTHLRVLLCFRSGLERHAAHDQGEVEGGVETSPFVANKAPTVEFLKAVLDSAIWFAEFYYVLLRKRRIVPSVAGESGKNGMALTYTSLSIQILIHYLTDSERHHYKHDLVRIY